MLIVTPFITTNSRFGPVREACGRSGGDDAREGCRGGGVCAIAIIIGGRNTFTFCNAVSVALCELLRSRRS